MGWQTLRFYLQNAAEAVAPSMSPAGVGFSWANVSQAIRRAASTTLGSSATGTQSITITATNGSSWLAVQFVSEPLNLTAPAVLGSGVFRCSTNEVSTSPLRTTTLIARVHFVSGDGATVRTPSGNQPDSGSMPTIYYSGPNVDSTSMKAHGKSAPVTPSLVGGVPQWHPTEANYADYSKWPGVVPGDRLVLSIGFSANGGTNRAPNLEYGESGAGPLSLSAPTVAGFGFFDLYLFQGSQESAGIDGARYSRPICPTHRPERFDQPATPSVPFLGEEAFG